MKLYVVRHGADDEHYRGGWSQRGLNVEGYRQAERLSAYLVKHAKDFPIATLLSSDLQRARETANEIARELNISCAFSSEWRETNNGDIAGMPNDIVNERYPGLTFASLNMDECYPGGESPLQFYKRIRSSFQLLCKAIEEKSIDGDVMVVTHAGVINVIYHIVQNVEWSNKGKKYRAEHTGLHTLELIEGEWRVTSDNWTGHLK